MTSLDATISALSSQQAIRVLALTADHTAPLPDPAQLSATDRNLRDALPDSADLDEYAPPADQDGDPGDLARATLTHLAATQPDLVPVITQAITMADDTTRFEPATLAVGALVVLALQTDVKLTRSAQGKWSFTVHKQAMRDSTLAQVISKLLGLYRPGG